ncbi:hypothetical protein FOCC_FOCC014224 [Frankliniella occidentalis]|uniref:Uncharacterized protein LOC113204911 n=1 Tax=Frankliniella occidentalis TaxID=133901 RepID=A0A6J1S4D3_FRAOC|nr:uncharacterized protein LOC113204911 [Frankliniella occidentalis]KAE8740263.1 hypothetical protein FOCC_FOCC014224 [Frankliniella occidentalis]
MSEETEIQDPAVKKARLVDEAGQSEDETNFEFETLLRLKPKSSVVKDCPESHIETNPETVLLFEPNPSTVMDMPESLMEINPELAPLNKEPNSSVVDSQVSHVETNPTTALLNEPTSTAVVDTSVSGVSHVGTNPETVLLIEPNLAAVTNISVPHIEIPTSALLTTGMRKLHCILPADWICSADSTGFSICFLNLGAIKIIQRQIFVSFSGEAKAYVHCSPCPMLDEIFSFVHNPVKFCRESIDEFCKSIMSLIEIVLQHRVCIGVNSKKYRDKWPTIPKSYIDLNPYLETSYEKTLRSSKCSKLITNESEEPRCDSCSKLKKYVKKHVVPVETPSLQ